MTKKVVITEAYTILGADNKAYKVDGNPFPSRAAAMAVLPTLPTGTYTIIYLESATVSQLPESADGTAIVAGSGGEIVDANGDEWTINASKQVAVNGVVDKTTGGQGGVTRLEYHDHVVYQETASKNWWGWVGDAWVPPGGSATQPWVSTTKPAASDPSAPSAPKVA